VDGKEKLVFSVDGTRLEHKQLADRFRQSPDLSNFETTPGIERD
jgi:hypothetical protein